MKMFSCMALVCLCQVLAAVEMGPLQVDVVLDGSRIQCTYKGTDKSADKNKPINIQLYGLRAPPAFSSSGLTSPEHCLARANLKTYLEVQCQNSLWIWSERDAFKKNEAGYLLAFAVPYLVKASLQGRSRYTNSVNSALLHMGTSAFMDNCDWLQPALKKDMLGSVTSAKESKAGIWFFNAAWLEKGDRTQFGQQKQGEHQKEKEVADLKRFHNIVFWLPSQNWGRDALGKEFKKMSAVFQARYAESIDAYLEE